jgi:hypothetical protein
MCERKWSEKGDQRERNLGSTEEPDCSTHRSTLCENQWKGAWAAGTYSLWIHRIKDVKNNERLWTVKKKKKIKFSISSMGCWFFGSSVFWAPCRFWLLVRYQTKIFSHSIGSPLRLVRLFLLLYRSFLVWCSLIYLSLNCCAIGVLFRKSLPLVPVYFLLFPIVVLKFQALY